MKKFRGKKKYYKRLEKILEEYNLNTSEDYWYDFWHIHLDWNEYAKIGWKHRKQHLKVLFRLFDKLLRQAENFKQPYQIWLSIDLIDVRDAIYVHTNNPNENNFPTKFEGIDWNIQVPGRFKELLDKSCYELGFLEYDGEKYYVVKSVAHGISI